MKTVYLYGKLGKRFGRKWSLNADSAVEVFAAIEANKEGFIEYLATSQRSGVEYAVLNKSPVNISSKKELKNHMISESMVEIKDKKQEMHIVPAPQGNAVAITSLFIVAGELTLLGKIVVGNKRRNLCIRASPQRTRLDDDLILVKATTAFCRLW